VVVQVLQLEHELVGQQQGLRGTDYGLLDVIQHLCAHWAVQRNNTSPGDSAAAVWFNS
jgi:hypothetical protein